MRIAIVGDIHGFWDELDNRFFDEAPIDLVLFTGDLARVTGSQTFAIAEAIARLNKPFALIAGNHDCTTLDALAGEVAGTGMVARIRARTIADRYRRLQDILGERLVGYSAYESGEFTVVGARPFAMDGERFPFAEPLELLFGVRSLAESAALLTRIIAEAAKPVIVLAHNGPRGLGAEPHDPFGVDFRKGGGDNGDPDLAEALATAGSKVSFAAAGHMHHKVRGSRKPRTFYRHLGGIPIVNGACVPRHRGPLGYFLEIEAAPGHAGQPREVWYDRESSKRVEEKPALPLKP